MCKALEVGEKVPLKSAGKEKQNQPFAYNMLVCKNHPSDIIYFLIV
jgi:hypothetical protein